MRNKLALILVCALVAGAVLPLSNACADMNTVFENVFNDILRTQLQLSGSPGSHGDHYLDAAIQANAELTPALNTLISKNVSSFPLSSTVAGTSFQMTPQGPVEVRASWGPIFAETATTLGKSGYNFGISFTTLQFDRFRGMDPKNIRFTFLHEDLTKDGGPLGDDNNESDTIDIMMDIDVDATIYAIYGTWGLLSNLDVGFALPIIQLSVSGSATATIHSFTYAAFGFANHNFGQDGDNPQFVTTSPYDENITGVGDVSVRAKYAFESSDEAVAALLLDARLPTGDEKNFLGSGETNVRVMGILSKKYDKMTPHANVAFGYRGAEAESNELEFAIGFDQSVNQDVTFAFDILGELQLDDSKTIELFPGSATIVDQPVSSLGSGRRDVDLSNVPEFDKDNTLDATFGLRYAPSDRVIVAANILMPMNKGGLRSSVATTFGLSIYH